MPQTHFLSPVGWLKIQTVEGHLTSVSFEAERAEVITGQITDPVLKQSVEQLKRYFSGNLREFDLPLAPGGTVFQQNVWQSLREIPYGTTISYLDLADKMGDKNLIRAVGRANGRNPLPIIIPCHRVIGTDGSLVGYGGGIEHKRRLLQHEGAILL